MAGSERDNRPLRSPMSPEVKAIASRVTDAIRPIIDDAWRDIAALPGDATELRNDGLSMYSNTAAVVSVWLVARMLEARITDPITAATAVAIDVGERITHGTVQAVFGARG